jgi:DNA-binding phage protein
METIGKIRRRRLIDHDSISQIARDLGLSRNTVKKALRSSLSRPSISECDSRAFRELWRF